MTDPKIYQLCLLPEAWPLVKQFIEKQWPAFEVVELPAQAQVAEEVDEGIRTFMMGLK